MSQTQGHYTLKHIKQADIWNMSNSSCFSPAAKQLMLMLAVPIFKFPPALPIDHSSGGVSIADLFGEILFLSRV